MKSFDSEVRLELEASPCPRQWGALRSKQIVKMLKLVNLRQMVTLTNEAEDLQMELEAC